MTAPINGPKLNGFSTAVQGLNREATRVAKAADDITRAFTSAQNAQAADSLAVNTDRAQVIPAVEDAVRGAVLPPEGDLSQAVVNLLQASTAYKANLFSARVTADVESDAVKLLKR
jgi:hypothetical protein